jgi:Zn-dependent protease with chaperone function
MEPPFSDHEAARDAHTAGGSTLHVVALGLLGYAYVLGIVFGLLAVAAAAVLLLPSVAAVIWVTVPLAVLAVAVLVSMWVRSPAPDGRRLERGEAPELFALVHVLRKELRAPRIHEVRVDGESFNAGVGQYPRLGIFGPHRNVLVVGLPLLLGLPLEEMRAVVAHELAHVSRRRGRTSAWIYRLRVTWERVGLQLEALGTGGSFLLRPFVRWYVPRFERASLALARAHEHEADEAAALIVGPETAASTLARFEVGNALLTERFWPELWKRADREPSPPPLLEPMGQALREAGEDPDAGLWLADALDAEPPGETTHPTLRARLAALGLEPERVRPRPARITTGAADVLFDPQRLAELIEELDARWQQDSAPLWSEEYDEAQEGASRLAELEARGAGHALPPDDLREYATLVSRFRGLGAAREAWARVLDVEPESGEAALALGELAAERGEPDADELLERAARLEPIYAPHALSILARLLARQGHRAEAAACRRRAGEALAVVEQAHAERAHLAATDEVTDHGLPAETVERIAALFDRKEIARAYLARKAPATLADHYPVYVVGYVRRGGAVRYERRGATEELGAELFAALQSVMPGPFWLTDLTQDSSRLHRRLRKLPGACIARRGWSARPLARAAPVLVGFLLVAGAVARFADDEPSTPPAPTSAAAQTAATNAIHRWARRAEDACSVLRTHADLRLEDVAAERGKLDFAEQWAVLRPFEAQLVESLRALPRLDHGDYAVELLERDLRKLDRIADDYVAGRTKAARAQLERYERDGSTEEAFAAVGIHACALTPPLAR